MSVYTGVEILTPIQRVPRWWIGEVDLQIWSVSCEYMNNLFNKQS